MKNEKLKNLSEKLKERKVCSRVVDFNFSEKSQKNLHKVWDNPWRFQKIFLLLQPNPFRRGKT